MVAVSPYSTSSREKWFFCVADIVSVLTESTDVRQYVKRLRQRDSELNSVRGTICTPHQFVSTYGKKHAMNCADLEGIFRIIQSISSPKAERIQQVQDPELDIFAKDVIRELHFEVFTAWDFL